MESDKSDLAEVIDAAAHIENLLDQVITEFYKPAKKRFASFQWILLNSSVMTLGAKVKVALAIANEVDFQIKINWIQEVIRFRNAFAHHSTHAHPVISIKPNSEKFSQYKILHLINSRGQLERISREDALEKFEIALEKAEDDLAKLLEAIRAD